HVPPSPRLPLPEYPCLLLPRLILVLCLLLCCCHQNTSSQNENGTFDSWQAPESPPVQNSGRTLSGDYALKSLDDDYPSKDRLNRPGLTYTFDKDGRFKREERSGGRLLSHIEGSYVIGTQSEVIFYVEKVGDDQVAAARAERYTLDEQPGGVLKLHQGSGT